MPKSDDNGTIKCSFCGKSQDEVSRIIAGPGVYICSDCIELCKDIIDDDYPEEPEELKELPKPKGTPTVHRMVQRDIPDLGEKGMYILHDIGTELRGHMEGCIGCKKCENECPEHALTVEAGNEIVVKTKNCLGTACYRCQFSCPKKVYKYDNLKLTF